ncbi:hypothetical protein H5410_045562 [Solanum commersonii]|uniref:Uncharacterized protein n=1 Tax=Solanum commersonii TaxID=4109 RepID=A0A9J5XE13_SOLCO|nr:hypothetical protein H5410_045562 [Solanum commersonii]
MQRSNVHSKIQVATHQYQRTSCSQYLLQIQVQAQPKCSIALTQGLIPYSHNGSQFKASELDATLTLKKKNTLHNFTHRFARIFQSAFVLAHSLSKRSFQATFGLAISVKLREKVRKFSNKNKAVKLHNYFAEPIGEARNYFGGSLSAVHREN